MKFLQNFTKVLLIFSIFQKYHQKLLRKSVKIYKIFSNFSPQFSENFLKIFRNEVPSVKFLIRFLTVFQDTREVEPGRLPPLYDKICHILFQLFQTRRNFFFSKNGGRLSMPLKVHLDLYDENFSIPSPKKIRKEHLFWVFGGEKKKKFPRM